MHKHSFLAAIFGAATCVQAAPSLASAPLSKRDIITPLPESADDQELRYQPGLDYDSDGCYNTAAIDPDGNTNPGTKATKGVHGNCRDQIQLDNSNAYSRKRCNNGYCAIMLVTINKVSWTTELTIAGMSTTSRRTRRLEGAS